MKQERRQINLKNIRITDSLFGSYVKQVSEKIILYQWKILNDQLEGADKTYCIENFRIAAGELEGTRKGVVFQDTDLYKWLESVAYTIAGGKGGQFEPLADEVIELVGRAQETDGYLNTYFTVNAPERKWKNLIEGHESLPVRTFVSALLCCIPVVTIPAALCAQNAYLGKMFRNGYGFDFSDYWKEFKSSLWKHLPAGLLLGILGQ